MITSARYTCDLATDDAEITEAQRLRFQVFNMELEEGLDQSYLTNLDQDKYDAVCQHIIVRDLEAKAVIGTYRLQTGTSAHEHYGYYSEQEFDLSAFDSLRPQVLELGRACIHKAHRNLSVLNLLWKHIAIYARDHDLRYLIGCSSLTSQDPQYGQQAFQQMAAKHLAPDSLRVHPRSGYECNGPNTTDEASNSPVKIPKLLRAYLTLGAKIGGPPAIDREFKTIDFLTILDLQSLAPRVLRRYLS